MFTQRRHIMANFTLKPKWTAPLDYAWTQGYGGRTNVIKQACFASCNGNGFKWLLNVSLPVNEEEEVIATYLDALHYMNVFDYVEDHGFCTVDKWNTADYGAPNVRDTTEETNKFFWWKLKPGVDATTKTLVGTFFRGIGCYSQVAISLYEILSFDLNISVEQAMVLAWGQYRLLDIPIGQELRWGHSFGCLQNTSDVVHKAKVLDTTSNTKKPLINNMLSSPARDEWMYQIIETRSLTKEVVKGIFNV